MNFVKIKKCDVANGKGIRVTLFVAGCPHSPKCKGCFNPETYDFNGGELFTEETENEILGELDKSYINGLTLLGGEPMDIRNQRGVLPLVKKAKELHPEKNIWCYTGFKWSEIMDMYHSFPETKELLEHIDILVDEKFVEELHNPKLLFRGSSNQNIIDVKKSLNAGELVSWDGISKEKI